MTTPTTSVVYALYVRGSFKAKWRLLSLHNTRDEATAASFDVKGGHVWVTTVPAPAPQTDPTKLPAWFEPR